MRNLTLRTSAFAAAIAVVAIATIAIAQPVASSSTAPPQAERQLGTIEFPTSGSGQAQRYFIQGVLLMHSFEYEDAATAFREAQRLDPDFAMAYWGEAMTYNHPIWNQQDKEAALQALAGIAPTAEGRVAKAPTAREKDWLTTLDVLYGDGNKETRDTAYADAMRRLHEKYPDDPEIRAFYSLSILGTQRGVRDQATYMRAAAVALPLFEKNPQHPGAAHYIIHSFDDPIHAPLGLPAARAYSVIAPAAAHAQHMCSHIFVATGMWDDVVAANESARDVEDAREVELGRAPNLCGHYSSWLQYGYLQQGRFGSAEELMNACHDRATNEASAANARYFANMRARYILDTERWDEAARWPLDLSGRGGAAVNATFTDGFAAAKREDFDATRRAVAEIKNSDSPPAKILGLELSAILAIANHQPDEAIGLLKEAAELEENLPFQFGPPEIVKPSNELLGEVLLELERFDEAAEAFRGALGRTPRRTASLVGLLEASRASGDRQTAADVEAQLGEIWHGADADFTGLEKILSSR